ncbi:uncharacterized protein BXZ73DRAFT_73126 [Epithele typhae]|uniref:uncharacterized protein n=1 Tax=Epithele typhae TaxID=378194 RepID=UPI002008C818|nr:uncharacterized protein BXZ73DRAFT_73126 [Epithele typhae]KAH9946346.1 hypothetical protein BXZ73DRAFT_73126 [Epithele typhae]
MASSSIVNAAVFAVGALVGGGVATVVASRNKKVDMPPPTGPGLAQRPTTPPIMDTKEGVLVVPPPGAQVQTDMAVLKYGHPGPVSDLLVRRAYVTAYDRRLRHPAWTAEHLTLASLGKSPLQDKEARAAADRQNSQFKEDQSVPAMFRARLQDYFRSGYDRGHMVPAADAKASQDAMDETFLLTNIAPQVGEGFNRHYWAYVEDWCRRLTGSFKDVYVFTVPLYLPKMEADGKWRVSHEVIGSPPNVAVPTHFAKVVLTTKPKSPSTPDVLEVFTGAFVLPNAVIPDEAKLESFVVPVDAVERAAGLTLISDAVKANSKHICQSTQCEVIVRRFDDARKRPDMRRVISAPK